MALGWGVQESSTGSLPPSFKIYKKLRLLRHLMTPLTSQREGNDEVRKVYLKEVYLSLRGWRAENYFEKTTVNTPDQDSNLYLPVIGCLVYCKSIVLDHGATEAEDVYMNFPGGRVENHFGKTIFSTPDQVSKLELIVIGSIVYYNSDALDLVATNHQVSLFRSITNKQLILKKMAIITDYLGLDIVLFFTLIISALYLYLTRNFNYWKKKGIPYLKPTPFFGNLKDIILLKQHIGVYLRTAYEQTSGEPYFGLFAIDTPVIVAKDLNFIKNILVKDFDKFSDRSFSPDESVDPLGAKSLFGQKGPTWRHLRVKMTPTFTSGKMKKMFYLVDECAQMLTEIIEQQSVEGKPILVKETMARFTTDVISSCAFGVKSNAMTDPNSEFRKILRKIFELDVLCSIKLALAFFVPSIVQTFKLRIFDESIAIFVRKTLWDNVDYREKNGIVRHDFVDLLMQIRDSGDVIDDNENDHELEGDDFVAQAFVFLAAGFETSSTTTTFALYELALNLDIQNKLRHEIITVLVKHDRKVTYDAMMEMNYLDMVVSETLRKYPALPFLDRSVQVDYKIPGTNDILEKGTTVFIPTFGIHYDPEYYPNPEKFDPERFSATNKNDIPKYAHLPFGEGPRNCIGMRFGLMQVKTGLIHLLSKFEVNRHKETPVPILFVTSSPTLGAVGSMPLIFNKIKG
uniref:Cytochrome P450 n=1 Tax=Timema cristinae TaxID=61476 RepID=A0A7R9GZV4_TIMCR|nr:unnamed protein product [Timema cristinae]